MAKGFDNIVTLKLNDLVLHFIIRNNECVPGKSVITKLLSFNDYISDSLNNVFQVDTEKLKKLGLKKLVIDWVLPYISYRTHRVLLNGNLSDPYKATSGVLQGTHRGPFLFRMFINDITPVIHYYVISILADDIKIFKSFKPYQSVLSCRKTSTD